MTQSVSPEYIDYFSILLEIFRIMRCEACSIDCNDRASNSSHDMQIISLVPERKPINFLQE